VRLRNFPAADAGLLPPHTDLETARLRRPELSMLALDPVLLSFELSHARPTLYHATQLSLPARRSFAAVLTVHDLAPLIWPGEYLRLPYSRIGHTWQYALARRADAIIAVSDATRQDVIERLGIPEARVHVVPEALLHAALLEGFGLTALESLAAGTPVVGYAGGAVAEVVGDAGLLVRSGDEEALAGALCRILDDHALRASLASRARSRAAAFSWDHAAQQTSAVYREVAGV